MAKPFVVLADPDAVYLEALELKFLEELGDTASISVITDSTYFDEFAREPHDIEALLVDESWYTAGLDTQNIENLFVLVEDQGSDRTTIMDAEYTFKYTGINVIFNKVMSACPQLRGHAPGSSECSVILFYSPVGGAGCTTLALGVSSALGGMYKRVLFVDAEYVQTFRCFLDNGKMAPSGMVREMAKLSGDPYENLADYIESDGFDYLPPLRADLSSYGLEYDFFYRFSESARDSGAYDYVIVDLDSVFNDEKTLLFGLADKVVVSVTQDRRALYKTMKFVDNLDTAARDKFVFVCNKFKPDRPNAFSDSPQGSSVALDGFIAYQQDADGMTATQIGSLDDFTRLVRMF